MLKASSIPASEMGKPGSEEAGPNPIKPFLCGNHSRTQPRAAEAPNKVTEE